jgi:CheY-like chemotaxis protein
MTQTTPKPDLPLLLLLEPDGLVRGTVSAVCRDLGLAHVLQVSSCASALEALREQRVQACMLSLTDRQPALELLQRLRRGELCCAPDIPVAITASEIDVALAQSLKELQVRRMLLKPFKVRDSIATIETLLPRAVETA